MDVFSAAEESRYLEWAERNPDGFVINYKSSRDMMLHRPGCWHFQGFTSKVNLANNQKVCSSDKEELERWASRHGQRPLKYCSDCKP